MTTTDATNLEDVIPALATANSDQVEIEALLDAIADPSLIVGHEDIDLVLDAALVALLDYDELPDRTIDVMLGILAAEEDDDVALVRKMAACNVLASMGEGSERGIPVLVGLIDLHRSEVAFERWLALRAAKAIWKISGNAEPAVEVATPLLRAEFWLAGHSIGLLVEIGPPDASSALDELGHVRDHAGGVVRRIDAALQKLERR